jgi:hypothetical protein
MYSNYTSIFQKQPNKVPLLLTGLALSIFLSWKITRLIILDFGAIWNLHVYTLFLVALFSLLYLKTKNLTKIDFAFICYLIFITMSIISNINRPNIKFIFDFLLTPLVFYFAAHLGKRVSDYSFYYVFNTVSCILGGYMLYEFISVNFMENSLIFYGNWSDIEGQVFTRMQDWNGSYFLRVFGIPSVRITGVAFHVHATGAFIAAFAMYHLIEYQQKKSQKKMRRFHLTLGVVYTIFLFVDGVGVSIFFFLILTIILLKKHSALIFISPFILFSLTQVLIDRRAEVYINYLPDYLSLSPDIFLKLFLFGDNQVTPHTIHSEFRMLGKPFAMGVGAFVFFHVLLFYTFTHIKKIRNFGLNYQSIWFFIMNIYLGSYHYNTIFIFPNSFFLFALCGFLAGRYSLIRKTFRQLKHTGKHGYP